MGTLEMIRALLAGHSSGARSFVKTLDDGGLAHRNWSKASCVESCPYGDYLQYMKRVRQRDERLGQKSSPDSKRVLIATFPDARLNAMKTHEQIDRRSLALAQAVADAIDRDPTGVDLERARATCRRWYQETPSPAVGEWGRILELEWEAIRPRLLDPGEEGRRLRQSSPFCGILSPRERWEIYRRVAHEPQTA